MNKKKLIIFTIICFIISFLVYKIYEGETKRISDVKEKQKLLQETFENQVDTKQIESDGNVSNSISSETAETSNNKTSSDETPISYTIIKKSESISEYYRMSVFNADIRISRKLTEPELKTLSYKLKSEIHTKAKDIRYFFYLPELEVDNGAWATTLFKPDYSFRIIGKSKENQESINSYIKNSNDELIGQWVDNGDATDIIYQLKKDKEKGFRLQIFSPSEKDRATLAILKKTIRDKKTTFVDMDEPTHYYVLEENGDLSSFDKLGFIFTMKKVE